MPKVELILSLLSFLAAIVTGLLSVYQDRQRYKRLLLGGCGALTVIALTTTAAGFVLADRSSAVPSAAPTTTAPVPTPTTTPPVTPSGPGATTPASPASTFASTTTTPATTTTPVAGTRKSPVWMFVLGNHDAVRFVRYDAQPQQGNTADGLGGDVIYNVSDHPEPTIQFPFHTGTDPGVPSYQTCHASATRYDTYTVAQAGTTTVACRSEQVAGAHAWDAVSYVRIADVSQLPTRITVEVWFEYPVG
jgi:hypothetical protein